MEVGRLDAPLGAEVRGIAITGGLGRDVEQFIRGVLDEHLVLVFRGHDSPSHEDLVAFAASFGPLRLSVADESRLPAHPEINLVSNTNDDAVTGTGSDGVLEWHSDLAFEPPPTGTIVLDAVELPPNGGNTWYTNLRAAYDALDDERQAEVEELHVEYRLKPDLGYVRASEDQFRSLGSVVHRLVQVNPRTGRRSIWPNVGIFDAVVIDYPAQAGRALLDELFAHATDERFAYEHVWQPGDLVMWSNLYTMHRRDPFDGRHRRVMRHLNIKAA